MVTERAIRNPALLWNKMSIINQSWTDFKIKFKNDKAQIFWKKTTKQRDTTNLAKSSKKWPTGKRNKDSLSWCDFLHGTPSCLTSQSINGHYQKAKNTNIPDRQRQIGLSCLFSWLRGGWTMADKRKGKQEMGVPGAGSEGLVPEPRLAQDITQRWPRKWDTPLTAFSWWTTSWHGTLGS